MEKSDGYQKYYSFFKKLEDNVALRIKDFKMDVLKDFLVWKNLINNMKNLEYLELIFRFVVDDQKEFPKLK